MSASNAASDKEVGLVHKLQTQLLTNMLQEHIDNETYPSAPLFAAVNQFLKNNAVTAQPEDIGALTDALKALQGRKKRFNVQDVQVDLDDYRQ